MAVNYTDITARRDKHRSIGISDKTRFSQVGNRLAYTFTLYKVTSCCVSMRGPASITKLYLK